MNTTTSTFDKTRIDPIVLSVTKTLRPKTFQRTSANVLAGTDEDQFLAQSVKTLKKGTFHDIDSRIQLEKYERLKYVTDRQIVQDVQYEEMLDRQRREERRLHMLQNTRELQQSKKLVDAAIKKNWLDTQRVKKDRQIHDLQFEQAVEKVGLLKTLRVNQHYDGDQKRGIKEFERILKRNGLGESDGDGGKMSISYEDAQSFSRRLEQQAQQGFPSNEEVSDFMTQLRDRTLDKKQARYEKARRKRRAMINQQQSQQQDDEQQET